MKRYVTVEELDALMDELRAGQTNLQAVKHSLPLPERTT
jgi:hypothetical protein